MLSWLLAGELGVAAAIVGLEQQMARAVASCDPVWQAELLEVAAEVLPLAEVDHRFCMTIYTSSSKLTVGHAASWCGHGPNQWV